MGGRKSIVIMDERRKIQIGGLAVFLASQVVYMMTLTPTCPFWDSGEYIATSYILGIPHPPGTPFYVLIGRLFTFLPIGSIAARVNYLSAFSSSLAALFGYLVAVEFFRWQERGRKERTPIEIGILGGIAAGLFTAFSRTFWENALEAEVYGLSSAIVMAAIWLVVRWAGGEGSKGRDNRLFVLAYYLVALSAGIHMGTFLVVPGLILFVLMVDHRTFAPSNFGALVIAGILIGLQPAMLPVLKEGWFVLLALGLTASLLLGRYWSPLGPRGVVFWCLLLGLIGLSNHLYLPIRSALDPMINEADPSNGRALWLALIRDQYKPVNPFMVRNAEIGIQLSKHFWRYFHDQYQLGFRPLWLANSLPFLVGAIGLVTHAWREKKTFLSFFVFFLITTIGMVFYLNFREDEVRDRDYFFTMAYQAFAVWIGLGFASLGRWGRWIYSEGRDRMGVYLGWGFSAVGVLLAFSTCANFYQMRDRSNFYLARDLAWNMLNPLEPNALIFTNGDNDTFPLWYLQEVEKVRRDVRVLNLSLLNTDWYIRQLRDYPPKVDVGWDDRQIEAVRSIPERFVSYARQEQPRDWYVGHLRTHGLLAYVPSPDEFVYSKDVASRRIIEREYGKKPIYFALTVPDQMGFTNRLTMQGVVFKLGDRNPSNQEEVDVDLTLRNLRDVYSYRGLLKADRTYDERVYKDDNAQRLVQNYAAGYIRAGERLLDLGRKEEALQAAEEGMKISRSASILYSAGVLFYRVDRFDRAEEIYGELASRGFGEFPVVRLYGRSVERQGRMADAEAIYRRGYELYPDDQEALAEIYSFYMEVGRSREAIGVLEDWVRRHPADSQARQRLQQLRDSL